MTILYENFSHLILLCSELKPKKEFVSNTSCAWPNITVPSRTTFTCPLQRHIRIKSSATWKKRNGFIKNFLEFKPSLVP